MEWVIESYDRRTDRDAEHSFATESAFISAAEDLLRNVRKGFVSTTPFPMAPKTAVNGHLWVLARHLKASVSGTSCASQCSRTTGPSTPRLAH